MVKLGDPKTNSCKFPNKLLMQTLGLLCCRICHAIIYQAGSQLAAKYDPVTISL